MSVTLADGVLRLVRLGARIDAPGADGRPRPLRFGAGTGGADRNEERSEPAAAGWAPALEVVGEAELPPAESLLTADSAPEDEIEEQPGLGDLEAAVALVSSGLATRVVLTGFPSWPGLLWHAYQLAGESGVVILPTVARPGGRVDIAITRGDLANG